MVWNCSGSGGRGGSVYWSSVDNTLLDLQTNSSYPTQPHSIIADCGRQGEPANLISTLYKRMRGNFIDWPWLDFSHHECMECKECFFITAIAAAPTNLGVDVCWSVFLRVLLAWSAGVVRPWLYKCVVCDCWLLFVLDVIECVGVVRPWVLFDLQACNLEAWNESVVCSSVFGTAALLYLWCYLDRCECQQLCRTIWWLKG